METIHRYSGNDSGLRSLLPVITGKGKIQATVSHAHFTSPESLCQHVEAIKESDCWTRDAWDKDFKFNGTYDMEHAIRLCRTGWPEGADKASKLRDKINAANPTGPRLARWDVAGAYPSVARALSGNPMNMRRIDTAALRRKPVLTIVHHMGGNTSILAATFQHKAAVVAAIIDAIESANFQVELIATSLSNQADAHFFHETSFTVKQAGQSADIGKIAFSIGHTSAFRRLVFACRSGDAFNRPLQVTLGATTDYANKPDAGVYVLPSLASCAPMFENEQAAATTGLAFFIRKLQEQDCPAFPRQEAA